MNASDLTAEMSSLPAFAAIAFACRCLRRVRQLCRGHHNAGNLAPANHMLDTCNSIVFGGDYDYGDTRDAGLKCEILDRLAITLQRNDRTYMGGLLRSYVEGVAAVGRGLARRDSLFGMPLPQSEDTQRAVECACEAAKQYASYSGYYKIYETHRFDLESVPSNLRFASTDEFIAAFRKDLRDIVAIASSHDLTTESTVPEDELEPL